MKFSVRVVVASLFALPIIAMAWSNERDFTKANVSEYAENTSGVYEIINGGTVIYVGRSRVSMRDRLMRHVSGGGSECVKNFSGSLKFRTLYGDSSEQMEAQLIKREEPECNLRGERDPGE
jgi:hypothetical protein